MVRQGAEPSGDKIMYNSILEANTTLINSGVVEMFDFEMIDEVSEYMYKNDATPEQAAKYFNVM